MNAQDYKQNAILTASPMELIVMLYDEAIKSLGKAEKTFQEEAPQKIEQINNHLIHAQDIITELAVSLDMEKGGDIAQHLHRLYDFMLNHLASANASKEQKPVQEVKSLLCDLRESWQQVKEQEPLGNVASAASRTKTGNIAISG